MYLQRQNYLYTVRIVSVVRPFTRELQTDLQGKEAVRLIIHHNKKLD